MKILYIASHRRAAEDAAACLRTVAPDVGVVWAASLGGARLWIDKNRNLSTLIVEVESDDPNTESFISQIRGLGVTAPVVVVSLKDPAPPLMALRAVADQVVTKHRSFLNDLPHVVTRALQTTPPTVRRRLFAEAVAAADRLSHPGTETATGAVRTVVERDALTRLNETLAAIAQTREDPKSEDLEIGETSRRDAEPVATLPVPGPTREQIAREQLERRLADASAALKHADERRATERESARQQAADRQAAIEAELTREVARRTQMEQALAEATAARQRAEARVASVTTAETARLTEQQKRAELRTSEATAALDHVKTQLAAERDEAAARLADYQRQADARSAEATAAFNRLQAELADTLAAVHRAEDHAAADRRAAEEAAARLVPFEAERAEEISAREALAKALGEAEEALRRAEQRHASELESATAIRTDHQRHAEAERAAATEAVDTLKVELADTARTIATLKSELADATRTITSLQSELADATQTITASRSELADAAQTITTWKAELADVTATLKRVEETAAADRAAAMEDARRHADLDARLAEERTTREHMASELAEAQAALRRADERHKSELSDASARVAEFQRRADARAAEAAAALDALRAKLVDGASALQRAEQQAAAERQAMADEASQRRAKFHGDLLQEVARRDVLAKQVAAAETRHQQMVEWHAEELAAAASRFTDYQRDAEARLADAAAAAAALQAAHAQVTDALARAQEQIASERQAATAEAAEHRTAFETTLARQTAEQRALEATLAAERSRHEQTLAAERAAQEQTLTGERHALEQTLTAERRAHEQSLAAQRHAHEQMLADERSAHEHAEARHAAALAAAETQMAEYRQRVEAEMAKAAAEAAAALHAADARAATDRQTAEARHASTLAAAETQMAEYRQRVEAEIAKAAADASAALHAVDARAAADRQTALDDATRQRAEFDTQLRQEIARRQVAEAEIADARRASEEAERRFLEQAADLRQHAHEHEALLEDRAARARTEWEGALADRDERIQRLDVACDLARQSLVASEEQIARLSAKHHEELAIAERARQAAEAELARERGERAALQTSLDETRTTAAQLTAQLASTTQDLESTARQRDVLKPEAARVPQLLTQIADIRRAQQRQFEDSPIGLCRCSPDGSILEVNRPLAAMLGYDSPDALEAVDFAAAVFESGAELPWIVDRRLRSASTESVDTTWRRRDRARIIVRLRVVATTADTIDLAAEDITPIRALEEKLRNAQRMESVARYASEVAATCDTLLRDVRQEAQEWLSSLPSGAPRYHGELLLDEVARAAGLLRQLSVYGNQQKNTADLVNVSTVLRDLEPVIRRVAGAHIDVVVPQTSMPLHVDVEAERVERILVNVAAYARGRMPQSGRLVFDVASVMMDRDFFEKYPNVRPGPHVLLTITEVRGSTSPELAALAHPAGGADATPPADKTGVDLGTLQTLVNESGGHLWMTMDPPGDMVLKIHLPRRVLDALDPPPPPAAKPGRARWIERLSGVRR